MKILITGATGSVGSAIALAMEKDNEGKKHDLVLAYRSDDKKSALKERLEHKNLFVKCSLPDNMDSLVHEAENADAIIHCVSLPLEHKEIQKKRVEDFRKHHDMQLTSFLRLVQAALSHMKKNNNGTLITILTDLVVGNPVAGKADYITAKYALLGLTKCLAVEYGKYGITSNSISPGLMDTELTSSYPSRMKELAAQHSPLNRLITPDDVARAAVYLCHSDSITGENIVVDAGYYMR